MDSTAHAMWAIEPGEDGGWGRTALEVAGWVGLAALLAVAPLGFLRSLCTLHAP